MTERPLNTADHSLAFADLLRRYRVAAGLTQRALAEAANLSERAVSDLERGTHRAPRRETVLLLADALALAAGERSVLLASATRRGTPAAARPAPAPAARPATLPLPLTPLVGREAETADIVTLLDREEVRLVTLSGPGGVGKTRVGLEVAARLADRFAGNVYFVPLAVVADPALVATSMQQALGLKESPGRSIVEGLKENLGQRTTLLLLDNFEQVIAAAPLIAELIAAAPGLKVLTTSRAVLHLQGEWHYPVAPLTLPAAERRSSVEGLLESAAVRLFVERARALKPDFETTSLGLQTVAAICARLDGLPLAIELAAARVRVLPPAALLTRLERRLPLLTGGPQDRPARQQTLRGAIAWSYDLLDAHEQPLFRRLAVFAGGWDLDAAEAVCSVDREADLDILNGLASLVDKSLIQQEESAVAEPRFRMLETVREYALEALQAGSELSEMQRRQAQCYLTLAEAAGPELQRPQQTVWLARLERDHDNLRAALDWSHAAGEGAMLLRLAAALTPFWAVRGYFQEGRTWLDRALTATGAAATADRAEALIGAGNLAGLQADYEQAKVMFEQGLALSRAAGDRRGIAAALSALGSVAAPRGDYEEARDLFESSLALYRQLDDRAGIAQLLNNLGTVAARQGDYRVARAMLEEGLGVRRELGDKQTLAGSLNNLGILARLQGDYERARRLLEESLTLRRELGSRRGVASSLNNLGRVAVDQGEYERAQALFDESLADRRGLGDKAGVAESLNNLGHLARLRGDNDQARTLLDEAVDLYREQGDREGAAEALSNLSLAATARGDYGRATALLEESFLLYREIADKYGTQIVLGRLASVAAARGDQRRAAVLFGAAEAMRQALDVPLPPTDQDDYERSEAGTRAALGEVEYGDLCAKGEALSMEDAVAQALGGSSLPANVYRFPRERPAG